MENSLTIIIPCKNEGDNLIKTIESVKSVTKSKIIVADSSTDSTREILAKKHADVMVLNGGLPGPARNIGASFSDTEWILFIDADMDIKGVNLEFIIGEMKRDNLSLSTTYIGVRGRYSLAYRIFALVQKIISRKTPFAVGGFMLFSSKEFRRLGGFNSEDKFAEDFHLSMKVDPKKFKIFNFTALTSDRRLRKKSVFWMTKLMILCWLNKYDEDFYKKDWDYWK